MPERDYPVAMQFQIDHAPYPIQYAIALDALVDPFLDKEGWDGVDRAAVKRAIALRLSGVELYRLQEENKWLHMFRDSETSAANTLVHLSRIVGYLSRALDEQGFESDADEWQLLKWMRGHPDMLPQGYFEEKKRRHDDGR